MSASSSQHAASPAPLQPSSKAGAAQPKLTGGGDVEMNSMDGAAAGAGTGAPVAENDIMQLARVGDIAGMEKLFDEGEFDATYHDDEGITPLHVG